MSTPTEKGEVSADQKEDPYRDWITNATKMVQLLYDFRNQHFPSSEEEKISDIEHQITLCVQVLESIPQERRQSEYERTMFEYLKGRLYNAVPDVYKPEAEHHLRNAIDLDPSFLDAWNCLGICLANKGDYHTAKRYFHFILLMGENTTILGQLAALELMFTQDSENPAQQIDECIKYAQRSLALDDMDARCLYTLGSAYFSSFLLTGGWDHDNLLLSLEAYEKAVNRYLENYKRSLIGFSEVALKNPALDAFHQMKLTLQLLDKLEGLIQGNSNDKSNDKSKGKNKGKSKGRSKGKSTETSLSSLIQSLATIDLNPSYNRATMDLLTEGLNKGIAVIGAVRCLVKCEYKAPVYYVLCDSDENSFALTVFGIQKEAIKQGDQVTLLEPFCKFVAFEWQGKVNSL